MSPLLIRTVFKPSGDTAGPDNCAQPGSRRPSKVFHAEDEVHAEKCQYVVSATPASSALTIISVKSGT